jgi:hypothetical protein
MLEYCRVNHPRKSKKIPLTLHAKGKEGKNNNLLTIPGVRVKE